MSVVRDFETGGGLNQERKSGASWLMLRGLFVVKQPTVLDGLAFDPFSFQQDGLTAPEVDVGRGEIVDALVIAPVVVVRDECVDLSFEIAGQIIVLEQDAVLERLMPALDFPLRHRMIRRTTRMRVPHPIRPRTAIVQRLWPAGLILIVPTIERRSRDPDLP